MTALQITLTVLILLMVALAFSIMNATVGTPSNWKWYRRLKGGHWEKWCVDFPVCGDVWHQVSQCSTSTGQRPTSICRGTPTCEHYPQKR